MENNYTKILKHLKAANRYKIPSQNHEKTGINYKTLNSDIENLDRYLISHLLKNELCKEIFFDQVENIFVFNQNKFIEVVFKTNEFMPESYTKYKNKIGIFLKDEEKIELNFPYKDCVLVGGMDKEDDEINLEIFYNETLEKNKINKLFEPKIFHNIEKYSYEKEKSENDKIDNHNNIQIQENPEIINFKEVNVKNSGQKNKIEDNLIIKGNNLLGLHSIARKIRNSIDIIYLDPPYYFDDTKAGDSFSYNSNFKLSTWLTFMKNRLEISKELLADDGVIFISTHDIGSAHLKLLLDDIFGSKNYIEQLSIENNPKGRKNSDFFSKNAEYCFVYAKDISKINSFNEIFKKNNLKSDNEGQQYTDGRRVLVGESSNKKISNFNSRKNYIVYYNEKENEIKLFFPESHLDRNEKLQKDKNFKEYVSIKNEFLIENTYTHETFLELFESNSLVFKEKTIYEKDRNIFKRCKTFISDSPEFNLKTESATKTLRSLKIDFKMSKNHEFILMLLKLIKNKEAVVLDFFAGSGTTAHSVLELNKQDNGNRKFILLEQMDYIKDTTCERVKRCMIKEGYEDSFIYMEIKESKAKNIKNNIKNSKNKEELISIINCNFDEGYFININNKHDLINKIENIFKETKNCDIKLIHKKTIKFIIEKHMENNLDYDSYEDIEEFYNSGKIEKHEYKLNKSFYKGE